MTINTNPTDRSYTELAQNSSLRLPSASPGGVLSDLDGVDGGELGAARVAEEDVVRRRLHHGQLLGAAAGQLARPQVPSRRQRPVARAVIILGTGRHDTGL